MLWGYEHRSDTVSTYLSPSVCEAALICQCTSIKPQLMCYFWGFGNKLSGTSRLWDESSLDLTCPSIFHRCLLEQTRYISNIGLHIEGFLLVSKLSFSIFCDVSNNNCLYQTLTSIIATRRRSGVRKQRWCNCFHED